MSRSTSFGLVLAPEAQRHPRAYRLVDEQGTPHPVLDDLYESSEAAWSEAVRWWENQNEPLDTPIGIGIEVSTPNGGWRTIRHPGARDPMACA